MNLKSRIGRERTAIRKTMKRIYGQQMESLIVHHIDGNPLNNNFYNLIILTRKEHYQVHKRFGGIRPHKRNNGRRRRAITTLDSLLTIYNTL